MDLLFKRYASPYLILDDMIRAGKLSEFILVVVNKENEQTQWEFWLHKVYGMGFEEYKQECKRNDKQALAMSDEQVESTVSNARNILKGFKPK